MKVDIVKLETLPLMEPLMYDWSNQDKAEGRIFLAKTVRRDYK